MTLTDFFPSAVITEFQMQWEDGWYPRGPSVAQDPDGNYAAMLIVGDLWRPQSVPPKPDDGVVARFAQNDGVIRTRNFFTHLDDDLQPIGWTELPTSDAPVLFPQVLGVEEPRLYWKDGWRFTGAIRQHHPSGDANAARCVVGSPETEIIPVPDGVWMKNLMPSATCLVDVFQDDARLHGGAVVPFEDGFLGVVHEIADPSARRYDQRFCLFDADGTLRELSPPFRFGDYPLEIAAGIVFHKGDVVVSYSVQDQECFLARFPLDEVLDGPCEF